jgi:hypothetical protein
VRYPQSTLFFAPCRYVAQEPGIADSLRSGQQFSLYLPASSLSGIKAQVVAERVEAVLLGATATTKGEVLLASKRMAASSV